MYVNNLLKDVDIIIWPRVYLTAYELVINVNP